MRKKCYDSRAERQKAYRKRKNLSGESSDACVAGTASGSHAPPAQPNLTAVPVLAKQAKPKDQSQKCGKDGEGACGEARESTKDAAVVESADSRGGSQKPSNVPQKEWDYACERAQRATDYAAMFPNRIQESEKCYQSPMWQWVAYVQGRMPEVVGGQR